MGAENLRVAEPARLCEAASPASGGSPQNMKLSRDAMAYCATAASGWTGEAMYLNGTLEGEGRARPRGRFTDRAARGQREEQGGRRGRTCAHERSSDSGPVWSMSLRLGSAVPNLSRVAPARCRSVRYMFAVVRWPFRP